LIVNASFSRPVIENASPAAKSSHMSEVACGLIHLSDRRAQEVANDFQVAEAFIFRTPLASAPVSRMSKYPY
jgi:hypothetical protein